jgi:DNA-directed RNA polymerase specialized sigma24 family protein
MVLTRAASADLLSPEGFERLLALLDQDRDRAGLRYEMLRRKLMRFFEWRNCRPPEELADETLDRVCRKLGEGLQIRVPDPCHYVYGVARNVAREATVRAARTPHATALPEHAETAVEPMGTSEGEPALDCLDRCLEALPLETRQLPPPVLQR